MNKVILLIGFWMLIFIISTVAQPSIDEATVKYNISKTIYYITSLSISSFISTMLTFIIGGFLL